MTFAWKLFDEGDKLSARKAAQAVLDANPTPKEKQEAEDLLERTRTPPFAFLMASIVAVSAIVLALLARRFS